MMAADTNTANGAAPLPPIHVWPGLAFTSHPSLNKPITLPLTNPTIFLSFHIPSL